MGWFGNLIFWGWNCIFWIAGVSCVLWGSSSLEEVSAELLILSLGIGLLLAASSCFALEKLSKDPTRLIRFFYCIQVPLFLGACYVMFVAYTITLGLLFVTVTALVAICVFFAESYSEKRCVDRKIVRMFSPRVLRHASLAMHNIMLLGVVYGLLISLFYLPLVLFFYFKFAVNRYLLGTMILLPIATAFYSLFFPVPPYVVLHYGRLWKKKFAKAKKTLRMQTYANCLVVALIWVGLFFLSTDQSQLPLRAILAEKPSSVQEVAAFNGHYELLQEGLLEQYVSRLDRWRKRDI